jgi:hypothetical protein
MELISACGCGVLNNFRDASWSFHDHDSTCTRSLRRMQEKTAPQRVFFRRTENVEQQIAEFTA